MKISMTAKLIAGVVLILAVSLAILERKASGILLGDKVQNLKDQSSQVSYSLAVSASEKIKRLDRHLRLILTHNALNTPSESRPNGDDMMLVGILKRPVGTSWETNWIIKPTDDRTLDTFSTNFAVDIQKTLQLDKIRSDEHMFTRMVASDGQPMFVMLIRLSKPADPVERIAAGVLSPSAFFDLVAPFKGSLTTAFLVDNTGVAYAHPSLSLTGAILTGNPLVDKISQRFAATQQLQYEDGDDTIIGSYDSVPRTNLVAASSLSLTQAAAPLSELKWNFAILGVGMILLAIILAAYISYLLKSPISKLRRVVDDLASGKRAYAEAQNTEIEISDLAESLNELDKKLRLKEVEAKAETHEQIYREKMAAFNRLSTGLVNELRNPLIGILGHTQLAREKIRDTEAIRRHLDLIERDVRKTKELIEDISQFAGADKLDVSSVNIFEALTAAIEQAGRKVHSQNVSILKNLEPVSSVTANAVLLRKALLNVLHSTAQLTSVDGTKEIAVRLENEEQEAKITIIFESNLIGAEDLGRIFDPFMKTEGQVDLGLDLALARGIFDAHDSKIILEQTGEVHFQFVIRLPKVRELPATETLASPFSEDPGLELKGLNFALPQLAISEQLLEPPTEPLQPKIIAKHIMPKVPLENLKIKIRKPTIRI